MLLLQLDSFQAARFRSSVFVLLSGEILSALHWQKETEMLATKPLSFILGQGSKCRAADLLLMMSRSLPVAEN